MKKKTTEEFIQELEAKGKHNDCDFSKFEYVSEVTKGIVICKINGTEHLIAPNVMLRGIGCGKSNRIGMTPKDTFLEDYSNSKHYNPNYDFSEFEYVNAKTKGIVINLETESKHLISSGNLMQGKGCSRQNLIGGTALFEEFTQKSRELGIKSIPHYQLMRKEGKLPYNFPADPPYTYKEEWTSWPEVLGTVGNGAPWTKSAVLAFLKQLQEDSMNWTPFEIVTILRSAGKEGLYHALNRQGRLGVMLSENPEVRTQAISEAITQIESQSEEVFEESEVDQPTTESSQVIVDAASDVSALDVQPMSSIIRGLRDLDSETITRGTDPDVVKNLIQFRVNLLWNAVLDNESVIAELESSTGESNFTVGKELFLSEYNEVVSIKMPSDYIFPFAPTLMQKLIAYRILNQKRYGNWSGTGAGKTNSAIIAARISGAKNTLIICNNSTVDNWVKSINNCFRDSNVLTKTSFDNVDDSMYTVVNPTTLIFNPKKTNYLILNYESFQLKTSKDMVRNLVLNNSIDYVVLDEVQNVKKRDEASSKRREKVKNLINGLAKDNADFRVLMLSATPIINNLVEGKENLNLLTGDDFDHLNTSPTIDNALAMFSDYTNHGLRYNPKFPVKFVETNLDVNLGTDFAHLLDRRGINFANIEREMLDSKLNVVASKIKRFTLIYTDYVTEIIPQAGAFVEGLGFSVGYYTGQDKTGLELFKQGKVDVLIASRPITTGIDGLQKICDNLIMLSLPWTYAEKHQLYGRFARHGSMFDTVNVYIPRVFVDLGDGNDYSMDENKQRRLTAKGTLADCAIDGIIPNGKIKSEFELRKEAQEVFKNLYDRYNGCK